MICASWSSSKSSAELDKLPPLDMDNNPALEEDRRGKKLRNQLIRQLVFLVVGFMVCGFVYTALLPLFSKTIMTLQAEPGETAFIDLPVLYPGFHVWIGDRKVEGVSPPQSLEDMGSVDFICRNAAFTVQPRVYDPGMPSMVQIGLTNECTEKVTIEMCWWFSGLLGC